MTAPSSTKPATVLFATDLSSRCDRALDRALIMARTWEARLVALTVTEPPHTAPAQVAQAMGLAARPARAQALRHAEQRLRADLAVDELPLTTRVAEGPVTEDILTAPPAHRQRGAAHPGAVRERRAAGAASRLKDSAKTIH
jgi:nucleotide-binding universal stress UspA family protein